jgi:hypothetical protein
VPGGFDLVAGASKYLNKNVSWIKCQLPDTRGAFLEGNDYLYAETSQGDGFLVAGREFGSQIFRKVIADSIDSPQLYNWRDNPFIDNTLRTIQKFESYALPSSNSNVQLQAC